MPLGDVWPLEAWGRRENPPYVTWVIVSDWIQNLAEVPWQAPSVPLAEASNYLEYEVREAVLRDVDIRVLYRRTFNSELVDLYWVGGLGDEKSPVNG